MPDNIDNATEVASERVEVPPDPGGWEVRSSMGTHWHTHHDECNSVKEAETLMSELLSTNQAFKARILRIPPQGEQADKSVQCPRCSYMMMESWGYCTKCGWVKKREQSAIGDVVEVSIEKLARHIEAVRLASVVLENVERGRMPDSETIAYARDAIDAILKGGA